MTGESVKIAGIVGSRTQVERSLSPAIHNAAFQALEMNWVYRTFGMDQSELIEGLRRLADSPVRGLNVTMPHKKAALKAMGKLSPGALSIGAINTIEFAGGLTGHNTDGDGLVRFLELDAGITLAECRVVILGAGGSSRAVIYALARAHAARITVAARDQDKARTLDSLAQGSEFRICGFGDSLASAAKEAGLIINATPIGQEGEPSPVPGDAIPGDAVVVDLVYRPAVTHLIQAARARGAIAHSGLGMLLHQAALSFEIWTGMEPPMEVMSAAALAEIARSSNRG